MIGHRARLAIAIAPVVALVAVGVARAQAVARPSGTFGGGALYLPVSDTSFRKDMLIAVRALENGHVAVGAQMYAGCGFGKISGASKIADDGSFVVRGHIDQRPAYNVSTRSSFVVRGVLSAATETGTGTARVKLRVRRRGHATRTCNSHTLQWTVRRMAAVAAPAPAPASATLYGQTSESVGLARRAIVLHTTDAGRAVDSLDFGYLPACTNGRIRITEETEYAPRFEVAADGSFRDVHRYGIRFADVTAHVDAIVTGQFDQAGGAAGTLSVSERFFDRNSGKRIDVCKTRRSWSARS